MEKRPRGGNFSLPMSTTASMRLGISVHLPAALIIVVQGAVLMNLLSQPEPIVPLGGPAAEGVVLQVRFHPDANEARIRALLQQVRGNIVGGPGALGVYRLRLDDMAGDAAVERTMNDLRAQEKVIVHVARE